jgi:ATP-dependent DNA helicase RecG
MNTAELKAWLRSRFPKENDAHEWKEWSSLKSNVSGRKGEDLISYVSALANMEGGCVIIGARDKTLDPTGIQDFADYTPENLPHRMLGRCTNLPSLGLHVEVLKADDTGAAVWVVHVPRHAAREPVSAHDKAWQRDGDSLVELRRDRRAAILAEPLAGADWSAAVAPGAGVSDLDPAALATARENYARRHATAPWAGELPGWSDEVFLDKARLSVHGAITRAALLLLGRPESIHFLSPQPAQITWKLVADKAVEHFGPPFLLTTSEALARIRNYNIKLYPATQLLPHEMPKYEPRVILEALHNCLAHQDYERAERVVIEEYPGHLVFRNAGAFFDGRPEMYVTGERQPSRYRNHFLAAAMVNVGMIDTGGMGIGFMYAQQRQRFLPLPDYEGSDGAHTQLKVFGQVLDENYGRVLMERTDLAIEEVVWLDRVQKGLRVAAEHLRALRERKLVEGRGTRVTISAQVAAATGQEVAYVDAAGLDGEHFRALVRRLLQLGPQPRERIDELLLPKLPESILGERRRKTFVKNLLRDMVQRGEVQNIGGATRAALWALVRRP